MSELKRKRLAAEDLDANDEISIEALDEMLAEELTMDDFDNEEATPVEDVVEIKEEEADEAQLPDDQAITSDEDEEKAVIDACNALEAELNEADEEPAPVVTEEQEIVDACNALEAKIAEIENEEKEVKAEDEGAKEEVKACDEKKEETAKCASEEKPGIEDEIGDEAHGGDPSVSALPDTQIDCNTDKEVFPTDSEYVARITKRLDRVANALEKKGMKKMAFRIDQLSDKLEASIRK